MRIAIDVRTLNAPKTGDRTVCLGLVKGLARIAEAEGIELTLVGREPPREGLLPTSPLISLHVVPHPGGYRWMPSAFPRACRDVSADVAFIQYMGPFHSPCPFVTLIHDTVWRTMPETFPRWSRLVLDLFIPGTIRRAAAVTTVSEFSASEIRRHFPYAAPKLHVVPNAVDDTYRPVTEPAVLDGVRRRHSLPDKYILSVGVLQPRKNVQGLVAAYRLLPQALRDEYGLVITGKKGWMVEELMAQAQGEPGIHFTGYVPDEDLPALYSMASCLAYPSLYEGFGLPPLEAMACGAPVVTSNVASLPEVCGDAAVLVNPLDTGAIHAALLRVLTDEASRRDLSARGLARAAQFDWVDSARKLLAVLRAAAAGH